MKQIFLEQHIHKYYEKKTKQKKLNNRYIFMNATVVIMINDLSFATYHQNLKVTMWPLTASSEHCEVLQLAFTEDLCFGTTKQSPVM